MRKLAYAMWTHFGTMVLSWTIQIAFISGNATEQGPCKSCEMSDRAAKNKLYNWLVLSIVLFLLFLLLLLVGFLCYRLWPRDDLVMAKTAFRCNLEPDQQRVQLVDTSSSRTSRGEQEV